MSVCVCVCVCVRCHPDPEGGLAQICQSCQRHCRALRQSLAVMASEVDNHPNEPQVEHTHTPTAHCHIDSSERTETSSHSKETGLFDHGKSM